MSKTWAKSNGKRIEVEVIPPHSQGQQQEQPKRSRRSKKEVPLIENPQIQQTALFMGGLGYGVIKGVEALAATAANPNTATRIRKVLPWGVASVMAFFVAPAVGRAKPVAQVAGVLCAAKGVYELLKPAEQQIAQPVEQKKELA